MRNRDACYRQVLVRHHAIEKLSVFIRDVEVVVSNDAQRGRRAIVMGETTGRLGGCFSSIRVKTGEVRQYEPGIATSGVYDDLEVLSASAQGCQEDRAGLNRSDSCITALCRDLSIFRLRNLP